ncbi:Phosphatidyl-N-methylethanolamine N-methyltransferase [Elasticomyces elasticus]|nr:Phosphatidyl-N-methylethanolamine N-methyltransferase [Elasticomyces elasticus]
MSLLAQYVDLSQPSLWKYRNKTITRLFGGNSLYGCYGLAVAIFSIGIIRDALCVAPHLSPFSSSPHKPSKHSTPPKLTPRAPHPNSYERALRTQPTHPALQTPLATALACALIASGNVLVLSSMYALGVTGTYLGDYFGILMARRVDGFPFSLTGAPMYWGSTMSFLGAALWMGRPAGVALTVLVYAVYRVALAFEE